jgi:predicted dehydrogenase
MGISLGLVGLGAFGSSFAPLFKSHPLVDRIALCDQEPDRLAAWATRESFKDKFNPRDAYATLDEICAAGLDALVVITQPWFHAAQCIQAMESGAHVYSAVPIVSLPDGDEILEWCEKLIATCRATGTHYMLGETTYYRPEAMYCRRKAAEGAFGAFVYGEGEYLHDVDHGLRKVKSRREGSKTGQVWKTRAQEYKARGIVTGPMHYPTHSTCGPVCVMKAHAVKVSAYLRYSETEDEYFEGAPSDETALFKMSNGATMRICEHREIGHRSRETFRIYGTQASFENGSWCDKHSATPVSVEEMRDPLPSEVEKAFAEGVHAARGGGGPSLSAQERKDFLGGHGGSHAYLVHEFVDAVAHDRVPAVNAWEAARYMAAGVMAHKSALKDGELLEVPDWGDAPE